MFGLGVWFENRQKSGKLHKNLVVKYLKKAVIYSYEEIFPHLSCI